MKEILWLGRGGQGAFTAAKLLGAAFSSKDENNYALAFPSFGPERLTSVFRHFLVRLTAMTTSFIYAMTMKRI